MDLEERTLEDTLERSCAVCGAQLTRQEIIESRESGGPFLCSVHAAGVTVIGLVCGGISEQELREAGADAVYGNVSEVVQDLEGSPVGRLVSA